MKIAQYLDMNAELLLLFWKNISHGFTLTESIWCKTDMTDAEYVCQVLAHLLDMVFYSDEKERVIPLLVNIMHYVVPYLRNHR